jgi:prepilin-type N-terminal cleavage/methylation domain-containing protein
MLNNRGFTLMEVLMYVIIVGILASIVMSSIRIARESGNDSAIKADLNNIRTEASNFFDTNNSYGTAGTSCTEPGSVFNSPRIENQISSAESISSQPATCANSATKWVISIPLRNETGSWCVDEQGTARSGTANTTTIECE